MKLNNRRTILVGLAFLSICTFWQMYDSVMTLILTDTFKLNETFAGAIMAADNVLALFLLPFFGALSDRTHTRIGRRMPFIVGGTATAAILMNLIPLLDDRYAANPSTGTLVLFIVVLGLLLVAMGTYRSPAVALMPDVTPKPLRSRANAIINLMGAVGGILYLGLAAALYPASKTKGVEHVSYRPLFFIVSMIMVVAVVVLYLTIKEPKLEEANQKLEAAHPEWNLATDDGAGHEVLPTPVKRSLAFLLVSISLWFIGYNGVTTWFTKYVEAVMGEGLGGASTCLLVATAGAIVSYIPIGTLAAKIGRLLYAGLPADHDVHLDPAHHVRGVCAGGPGVGRHQRELAAHGGGNVPRQRHRQVHRILLHLLDGRAGRHAHRGRLLDASHRLPRTVSLRRPVCSPELCDHVLRQARRHQSRGKEGAGCV